MVARLTGLTVWRSAEPVLRSLPAGAVATGISAAVFLLCSAWPAVAQLAVTGLVLVSVYALVMRVAQPVLFREIVALTVGLLRKTSRRREGTT